MSKKYIINMNTTTKLNRDIKEFEYIKKYASMERLTTVNILTLPGLLYRFIIIPVRITMDF